MGTHPIFESDFDCLTDFLKMPFLKSGMRRKEPLWRERDRAAQKEGLRSTVYYVNGDHYCGEWSDNLRHGLGVMTYKKDKTQYTGDWVRDEKAGEGILSQLINGVYKGIYSGQWRNDERNGTGVNFYPEKEAESEVYYDGNWLDDKRHGQGKMFYGDKPSKSPSLMAIGSKISRWATGDSTCPMETCTRAIGKMARGMARGNISFNRAVK